MRKLLLCSCLLASLCSFAQTLTPAEQTKIDSLFARYAQPGSPGCALGVYRNGALAYAKGYGLASLEHEVPITPRTVFDIGSTSKQFTAFAVLLLEQRGKLSLDDDVRKYLPELPDYGSTITLRHLLAHTSGLRDYPNLFVLSGKVEQDLTTDQDAQDLIARQKRLNFRPGEEWDYSNSGYFLLSQVVKRVSGQSLRDFAQENIFKPLGMTSTQIMDWHGQVVPHRATGYSFDRERRSIAVDMSNFEQVGDGGVQTTVEDLLRWDENFYTGKVGGTDLLRKMTTRGKLNNGNPHGYGMGLYLGNQGDQPVIRHGGSWAGYRAELVRYPQQHTSIALLCNLAQSNPTQSVGDVVNVVLASVFAPKPQEVPVASKPPAPASPVAVGETRLRARASWYRSPSGEYQRIEFKDGKLFSGQRGDSELIADSENSFHEKYGPASFAFTEDGVSIAPYPGVPGTLFARVKGGEPKDLKEFAGDYFSSEVGTTWEFRVVDGRLILKAKPLSLFNGVPLMPVTEDTFTVMGGEIRFVNTPGEPARVIVTIARLRNLEFVRKN